MRFNDWENLTIDEVCTVTDCQHKTAPTVDELTGFKMIRTANVRNGFLDIENMKNVSEDTYEKWSIRGKLEPGDVILTREAPMGEVGLISNNQYRMFLGQRTLQLKPKPNVTSKFLFYSLQGPDLQRQIKMNEGTGSVVSNIRIPILRKMEISIPKIEVQEKIAKILFDLDTKIALNNQMIDTLEEMASTLFKRWFVDFEFPDENGNPYKSSGGKMIDSELGKIPEGWRIVALKDVFHQKKENFNPSKFPNTEVTHFSMPSFDKSKLPIIDNTNEIKSNKNIVGENSVLFSKMNPETKRVWLPNFTKNNFNVTSTEFIVVDSNEEDKMFLYTLLLSLDFQNYLVTNATGSTGSRQRIRPSTAMDYSFAYSEEMKIKANLIIGRFSDEIINLREEIQTLEDTRDSLLPKLLSGEIIV